MDPTFSVYERALQVTREKGGQIQDLGRVERFEPRAGSVGFATQLHGMLHWCRVVEKLIVDRDLRDAEVHVGFEKLSRLEKARPRYEAIEKLVPRLVILGEPDAKVTLKRAHVVSVLGGPLREEWFLIVRSARYSALISARDLDGLKLGAWEKARRFVAVATHDPQVIDRVASDLDAAIAQRGPATP